MRYCGSLPGNTHSSPPSPSSPIVSLFSTLLYARMCVRILCGVPTVPFVPAPLFMTLFLQGWLLRALVFGKLPLAFTNQFHSIRQRNTIVMFDKNYSIAELCVPLGMYVESPSAFSIENIFLVIPE